MTSTLCEIVNILPTQNKKKMNDASFSKREVDVQFLYSELSDSCKKLSTHISLLNTARVWEKRLNGEEMHNMSEDVIKIARKTADSRVCHEECITRINGNIIDICNILKIPEKVEQYVRTISEFVEYLENTGISFYASVILRELRKFDGKEYCDVLENISTIGNKKVLELFREAIAYTLCFKGINITEYILHLFNKEIVSNRISPV